jgi:Flp pilus assembly protein TadG
MTTNRVHLLKALRLKALRHGRDESGQAIVEFALVMLVLLPVIFFFVAGGKAIYDYIQFTHFANEGARLAAVNEPFTSGTLKTNLCNQIGNTPSPTTISISYPNGTPPNVGDPVQVTVSMPFQWFPFIKSPNFTITATDTMRLEQTPGAAIVGGTC